MFSEQISIINIKEVPSNIYNNIKSFNAKSLFTILMPFCQIFMGAMYCFLNWILISVGIIWIIFGFVTLSGHHWNEQHRATLALHIISPIALVFVYGTINWMTITMWSMHGASLIYFGLRYLKRQKYDEGILMPSHDELLPENEQDDADLVEVPLHSISSK
eukprot:NODE_24_length_41419_cov_0.818780.p28 type:complete len:161 gc:universal NODE_24_length_41419_cov_0.818780:38452-38934(+)